MSRDYAVSKNSGDIVIEASELREARALAAERLARYVEALDNAAKNKADSVVAMLREERKRQGLTQAQISELTGIATPNIARLEKCKNMPSFQVLNRYAEALGMVLQVTVSAKS